MDRIETVKVLLGIRDALQDDLLRVIEDLTLGHFRAYTGQNAVPSEFEYIITEVMVKRFNRLGAEGRTRQHDEGMILEFERDDFDVYYDVLRRYYDKTAVTGGFKLL